MDDTVFREVLGRFPTGVTVVASVHGGQPTGLLIGSFFSVSLDPPLVGFCAGKTSSSWVGIRAAGAFCVNVLREDQRFLYKRFARPSAERFDGVRWQPTKTGSPRLADSLAWIDCTIHDVVEAGDHDVCIGLVHDLRHGDDGSPLLFYRRTLGSFTPSAARG